MESWLWVAIEAPLAASALLAVAWAEIGPRDAADLALWILPWLIALHIGIALGLLTASRVRGRRTGSDPEPGVRRLYGLILVALGLALNGKVLAASRQAVGGGPWLWAALIACAAGILCASGALPARRIWARTLGVVAAALTLSLLVHASNTERIMPEPPPAALHSGSGERLLVVGLDGADWGFIEQLISRGELPNLRELRDNGAWGPLATYRPTVSPLLWTTMVTGVGPAEHGIEWHLVARPRGRYRRFTRSALPVSGLGVGLLRALLGHLGLIVSSPPTSAERLVPAYWNIATHFGSPVTVVNWWATWPAEAVLGRIVSDRAYFWRWAARGAPPVGRRVTFPEALFGELQEALVRPDQVTFEDARRLMDVDRTEFDHMMALPYDHHELPTEFKYYYSMFASHRGISRLLLERDREHGREPADLLALFRIVDYASHSSLVYSDLVEEHLGSTDKEIRSYRRVVTEAYRMADEGLGDLIEAFGPGNVVVLSDHGFELEDKLRKKLVRKGKRSPRKMVMWRGDREYNHNLAPSGIFIASGPAFEPGRVEGLSVFEVLPLILELKGWPVARDFEGRVPTEVFTPTFLETNPVRWIESYRGLHRPLDPGEESPVDEQMIERLRALGYVD